MIAGALAPAEERESVSLTEVAATLGVGRDELIKILTPVVLLEFRDSTGEVIAQIDAFDLDVDADMLHVRAGHWLRDWDASGPSRDAVLRLFVTAAVYQATGGGSADLDAALAKLRQLVAIDLVVPDESASGVPDRRAGVPLGAVAAVSVHEAQGRRRDRPRGVPLRPLRPVGGTGSSPARSSATRP